MRSSIARAANIQKKSFSFISSLFPLRFFPYLSVQRFENAFADKLSAARPEDTR